MFQGIRDAEVSRISKECKAADGTVFASAFAVSPRPAELKNPKYLMAERLLHCWREHRGDMEEGGGVEGLKTWMYSNPTEQVSRP